MSEDLLANSYMVADRSGGHAVMIDAGGPVPEMLEFLHRHALTLDHVLLTHHHDDHISGLDEVLGACPDVSVLIHELEFDRVPQATGTIAPGEIIRVGGLVIEPLHTPGHTPGMLSFLIDGSDVFTGDTLFRGSVGGVGDGGQSGYTDLRASIMETLMTLPPQTRVRPGHTDGTTIGDEKEHNAFIRVWRGVDPQGSTTCSVNSRPATLILLGNDYDGGHKAWVRWPDGRDEIVPGSLVES